MGLSWWYKLQKHDRGMINLCYPWSCETDSRPGWVVEFQILWVGFSNSPEKCNKLPFYCSVNKMLSYRENLFFSIWLHYSKLAFTFNRNYFLTHEASGFYEKREGHLFSITPSCHPEDFRFFLWLDGSCTGRTSQISVMTSDMCYCTM